MKKILIQIVLLVSVLIFDSACLSEYDVRSVSFRGDSTLMGMKIERFFCLEGNFIVETTGGIFEYTDGALNIYQGLDRNNRRLLATITTPGGPDFSKVEATDDHILLWSEQLNVGIYGDSTLILAPKTSMELNCKGNFKPAYEGRFQGELLLIDDLGGMEIYPQRYEAGYELKKLELGREDWTADYLLKSGERVMIATFPGRPFDWDKSFNSNVVVTCGSVGLGEGNIYGQMPSNLVIKSWSETFQAVVMFYMGLYSANKPGGPYIVENDDEFRRFVNFSHSVNMKVMIYASLFYWRHINKTSTGFVDSIRQLKNEFQVDGVYIDGLTFDSGPYIIDDKIENWQITRDLRELFGADGFLMLHGTNLGTPVATAPNIDTWYDIALNGENVKYSSLEDPYIKYQARKYGISNTIGIWYTGISWYQGPKSQTPTRKQIIDKALEINCREWWGAFVPSTTPPPRGKYIWPTELYNNYDYYLKKLSQLKTSYYKQKK